MKKLIWALVFLFSFNSSASAELMSNAFKSGQKPISNVTRPAGALSKLQGMGGLTFFKDYSKKQASLNADYSVGSPTASFSVTRQATNSTYVDDDGVIRLADTSVNRKNNYYDATGFHARSGVLLEPQGTNLLAYSKDFNNAIWVAVAGEVTKTVNQAISPDGTQNAALLEYVGTNGRLYYNSTPIGANGNGTYTFSIHIRAVSGTATGKITINNNASDTVKATTEISVGTSWKRYSVTGTTNGVSPSCRPVLNVYSGQSFYIYGAQLEFSSSLSSYIPTTTAAVTRGADAPSTYVDASGVIQVNATNNTPRYQGGWYDATGFHAGNKGLMVEGAGTNLVKDSDFSQTLSSYWSASFGAGGSAALSIDTTYTSPYSGGSVMKFVGSKVDDRFSEAVAEAITVSNATVYTVSMFLRGSGDVYIRLLTGTELNSSKITLTNAWTKYSFSGTTDGTTAYVGLRLKEDNAVSCFIGGIQLEASPYATSFIPTTTASMSRTAEVLKYAISGNRTAATESVFAKFAQEFTMVGGLSGAWDVLSTEGHNRELDFPKAGETNVWRQYAGNGSLSVKSGVTTNLANTSTVISSVGKNNNNPSATMSLYRNGSSTGTPSTTNWTADTFGTNFTVGCSRDGNKQIQGVIQSIAIFSDAKDATTVGQITSAMNS